MGAENMIDVKSRGRHKRQGTRNKAQATRYKAQGRHKEGTRKAQGLSTKTLLTWIILVPCTLNLFSIQFWLRVLVPWQEPSGTECYSRGECVA